MSQPGHVGDLEINEDVPHARLEWKIERVGWVLMAFLLIAALAGLLGPGPISSATAGTENSSLWVEYNRFERYQAPAILRVHLGPHTGRDGRARISLRCEYIESIELQHIDPEPESVEVTPDHFIFTFNLSNSDRPTTVSFHFEPNRFWRMPVTVGLENEPDVEFSQFVYP